MIALLAAAALSASPAPAATAPAGPAPAIDSYTAQEVAYAHSALTVAGWNLLSAARDLVVFYRGAPSQPIAKVWIRGEHYPLGPDNPLGNGESFVNLYEIDCVGDRARTLSSTVYSGAKMQGDIVAASDKSGDWVEMKPGGFTALGAQEVCRKTAAPPAQAASPNTGPLRAASDSKPTAAAPQP
jgi:opacity protein-like surface antigen